MQRLDKVTGFVRTATQMLQIFKSISVIDKSSRIMMLGQVAIVTLTVSLYPGSSAASGWKLVFEDNFNGKSLNRTQWATRYIFGNENTDHLNDEVERYRDNHNHEVANGILDLVARKSGDKYESGMIRSRQAFYYGYFEAKVKLPKGRGVWPAFWLGGDYSIDGRIYWPPEIDIFEYVINQFNDKDTMFHSAGSNFPKGAKTVYDYTDASYNKNIKSYVANSPLNQDWHVFGLVWRPNDYTVFIDGKRVYTRRFSWVDSTGNLAPPAHILLNFAVGGRWAGRYGIDESNFPQALSIDYVRVCQYSKDSAGKRDCGNSTVGPDPEEYSYNTPMNDIPKPVLKSATLAATDSTGLAQGLGNLKAASHLHLQSITSNMSIVPKGRKLYIGIRYPGSRDDILSSLSDISENTYSEGEKKISGELVLTSILKPGKYEVVEGLAVDPLPSTLRPQNPPHPNLTPARCETQFDKMPKAISCIVGNINIIK